MSVRSVKWSASAGVYASLWGAVLLQLLDPVSDLLAELLGASADYSALLLAAPAAVVGALAWWAVVERRGGYTYVSGAGFGLLTVVATVGFWLAVFAVVWEPGLVLAGWVLVAFVWAVTTTAGLVVGVSAMYGRRHLDGELTDGREATHH